MEDIVKYLSNPLQAGVYYGQFTINFSKLEQFIRDIAKTATKQESKELIKTADSIKEEGYLTLEETKENFNLEWRCSRGRSNRLDGKAYSLL